MAASDKNIVISPQRGSATLQPSIVFTGDGNDPLTLRVLDSATGSLSIEGSAGQLFGVSNSLASGSIFSANYVSGIPAIDVDASGVVSLVPTVGNVGIGTTTPDALLTVNGVGAHGLGSASAPSFAFIGDLNTGIYSPGADQVAISTNGTGRLFVDASGKLGLGTSSPVAQLEVQSSAFSGAIGAHIKAGDGGSTVGLIVDGDAEAGDILIKARSNNSATPSDSDTKFIVTGPGNVGVGTTSPSQLLHVYSTSTADNVAKIESTDSSAFLQFADSSTTGQVRVGAVGNNLAFWGGSFTSEAARIDSSGRLLVGTSSTVTNGQGNAIFQVTGNNSNYYTADFGHYSNDAFSGAVYFKKTRSTTAEGFAAVVNNDYLGDIRFAGADGSTYIRAASIECRVDGTPGANDMPGRLVFSTTAAGASSPTERMRISSNGVVTISGNTAWHAGNDGAGSGLDADTLDGQQGSYYQPASSALTTSTAFGGDVSGTYNAIVVANDSHTHDGRYYTETESDARFLGISAKAADSNLLDGIDSSSFLRSDTNDSASGVLKFTNYTQFGPDPSDTGSNTPYANGNAAYFVSRGVDQDDARSNVIRLMRDGTVGVIYAGAASFDIDRWQADSVNARTRLFLSLAHSSSLSGMTDVMSWRSDGLVQIAGNTTWHAGNDGSGSGLDADLLDGQQGSYYLDTSATAQTKSGGLNVSGNVGIGTDSPASELAVNGYITESTDSGTTYWNVVTQQDIGTSPNQVPLNQYLGQLAFMDDFSPNGLRREGGSTDDVFVNSSGNVGIGTDNPTQLLHLEKDSFHSILLKRTGASPSECRISNGGNLLNISNNVSGIDFATGATPTSKVRIESNGNVGIGTTNPAFKLDVNSDSIRVVSPKTPASATDTGTVGQICWDANYVYVCVATNTWKRSALSSW